VSQFDLGNSIHSINLIKLINSINPINSSNPSSPGRARPPAREWLCVLLLLTGFLGFNLATYNLYPQVWCDEVWFSEPAVNAVNEGVFHSRTFKFQPPNTFPTINCPLYLMAQVPWLRVFGTSVLAIRSFNYSLMALSAFLVWMASWRFGLVKSGSMRLLLLVLLHLGYGMSFAYRCSRPDILGMVCLLLLLLAFAFRRDSSADATSASSEDAGRADEASAHLSPAGRARDWCILALSAVSVWIGLQVGFFIGFACLAAAVLLYIPRWESCRAHPPKSDNLLLKLALESSRGFGMHELVVVSLGLALGVFSMLVFLAWKGALANFLPQIVGMMGKRYAHATQISIGVKFQRVVRDVLISYIDDFSTDALLIGLAVLLLLGWKQLSQRARSLSLFCLALVFGAPLLFDILGHWAFYYSYMRFVPASLALFAVVCELAGAEHARSTPRTPLLKPVCVGTVLAAMGVGLPMRLALSLTCTHLASREELLQMIRSQIRSNDVVVSDQAPFFEVKQVAREVYAPSYSAMLFGMHVAGGHEFSAEERRSISVLVLRPERAELWTNYFGGRWQAVSRPFGDTQDFSRLSRLPVIGSRLAHYAAQPQTERYQVQILRRVAGPGT
jgi:hypothetical protein